jgi:hypothetical protein
MVPRFWISALPTAMGWICPQLNGHDGRKAGTAEGYAYSDSNKNSGIVWSEARFKELPRRSSRQDAWDKDDLLRQERERSRGFVGLSQPVWNRWQEEKSVTALAGTWSRISSLRGECSRKGLPAICLTRFARPACGKSSTDPMAQMPMASGPREHST